MAVDKEVDVLIRLKDARHEAPELAEVIDLHYDLFAAEAAVTPPLPATPDTREIEATLAGGVPLIRQRPMALDWEMFFGLYQQICDIAGRHRPDLAGEFASLRGLPDRNRSEMQARVVAYIEGGSAEPLERESALLPFVVTHALRPFLQVYALPLASVIARQPWRRRACPVCGGEPDLAYLDDESGSRHLICGRCDTEWVFPRVKCPFCATTEPDDLLYYPSEDDRYRLYVCKACKRYLKAIDLRKARQQRLMPEVERLLTVDMDEVAREEGYR